jgi:hypothetical protein
MVSLQSGSGMFRPCQLCARVTKQGNTGHHLIPRTCHSNKWFRKKFTRQQMSQTVELCGDCHRAVHRLIPSEKQLGRHYHSLERLRAHPQIVRYVRWVRKQR